MKSKYLKFKRKESGAVLHSISSNEMVESETANRVRLSILRDFSHLKDFVCLFVCLLLCLLICLSPYLKSTPSTGQMNKSNSPLQAHLSSLDIGKGDSERIKILKDRSGFGIINHRQQTFQSLPMTFVRAVN